MFRVKNLDFARVSYSIAYHLGSANIRQAIPTVALKWTMLKAR